MDAWSQIVKDKAKLHCYQIYIEMKSEVATMKTDWRAVIGLTLNVTILATSTSFLVWIP
jgi:hypothetical protein